ncbi:hypothetical protein [uncultured Duncaniella sp.]|nr:hypothetical protein [uncultured Duncaniella sp.]
MKTSSKLQTPLPTATSNESHLQTANNSPNRNPGENHLQPQHKAAINADRLSKTKTNEVISCGHQGIEIGTSEASRPGGPFVIENYSVSTSLFELLTIEQI